MQGLLKKHKPDKNTCKLEELKNIFPSIKINSKGNLEKDQKIMLDKLSINFSQIPIETIRDILVQNSFNFLNAF